MSAVTIQVAPETERKLQERAKARGQSFERFVEHLLDAAANGTARPRALTSAEFTRALDSLSEDLPSVPTLPADFSRADIYAEHD